MSVSHRGHRLAEIGRVLKPPGALYIAVPDASTFGDRLYRWLTWGGGHVNAFTSARELAATIEQRLRRLDEVRSSADHRRNRVLEGLHAESARTTAG